LLLVLTLGGLNVLQGSRRRVHHFIANAHTMTSPALTPLFQAQLSWSSRLNNTPFGEADPDGFCSLPVSGPSVEVEAISLSN
jgi:hypothetical protein